MKPTSQTFDWQTVGWATQVAFGQADTEPESEPVEDELTAARRMLADAETKILKLEKRNAELTAENLEVQRETNRVNRLMQDIYIWSQKDDQGRKLGDLRRLLAGWYNF